MAKTIKNIKANKITKKRYDELVANGTITPKMIEEEIWIFLDDEVVTSEDKEKWNNKSDFSGDYKDLSGTPYIPKNTSDLNNDAKFITNADVPKKVSQLTNDSGYITNADIPTKVSAFENDAKYITKADVPTKVSELENDANYLDKETDPTVPDWAKEPTKPTYTKGEIGLSNVEDKSSETIRSEITKKNVTDALGYTPINEQEKGANNGVAELDSTGKVPSSQLPSYVDDVLEFDTKNDFPDSTHAESGKVYIAKDTNITYRWGGTNYVPIGSDLALGETSSTAFRGDHGKEAYAHAKSPHAPADAEKNKIESISVNGTKQPIDANRDVNINVPTKVSELTNDSKFITKDDVPTKLSEFTNDSKFITAADIPAQVQPDWEQTDNTKPDFIKNKPDLSNLDEYVKHVELYVNKSDDMTEEEFNENTYYYDIPITDLQSTLDSLPKYLDKSAYIDVQSGTLDDTITIPQLTGPGDLTINGTFTLKGSTLKPTGECAITSLRIKEYTDVNVYISDMEIKRGVTFNNVMSRVRFRGCYFSDEATSEINSDLHFYECKDPIIFYGCRIDNKKIMFNIYKTLVYLDDCKGTGNTNLITSQASREGILFLQKCSLHYSNVVLTLSNDGSDNFPVFIDGTLVTHPNPDWLETNEASRSFIKNKPEFKTINGNQITGTGDVKVGTVRSEDNSVGNIITVTQEQFDQMIENDEIDENTLYNVLDLGVSASTTVPVGAGMLWFGDPDTIPHNYVLLDGEIHNITDYPKLYKIYGTKYGGDGTTTFGVPNLKGRVVVMLDPDQTEFNTLGKASGEKVHKLTTSETPKHSHTRGTMDIEGNFWGDEVSRDISVHVNGAFSFPNASNGVGHFSGGANYNYNLKNGFNFKASRNWTGETSEVGSDKAHNNLQPYTVAYYIVKAKNDVYTENLSELDKLVNKLQTTFDEASKHISSGILGGITLWPNSLDTLPPNYMWCNGQELLISAYPLLFSVIGNKYGGDGVTTFRLPNLSGYTFVGVDESSTEFNTLGKVYGSKTHKHGLSSGYAKIGSPQGNAHGLGFAAAGGDMSGSIYSIGNTSSNQANGHPNRSHNTQLGGDSSTVSSIQPSFSGYFVMKVLPDLGKADNTLEITSLLSSIQTRLTNLESNRGRSITVGVDTEIAYNSVTSWTLLKFNSTPVTDILNNAITYSNGVFTIGKGISKISIACKVVKEHKASAGYTYIGVFKNDVNLARGLNSYVIHCPLNVDTFPVEVEEGDKISVKYKEAEAGKSTSISNYKGYQGLTTGWDSWVTITVLR